MLPRPTFMALDLTVWEMLGVSAIVMLALLLLAYGIAGWHERWARSRKERPKEAVAGPQPFNIPYAIGMSILTFTVYTWVLTYRNSRDIHGMTENGFAHWRKLFWGAVVAPLAGILLGVLVMTLPVALGLLGSAMAAAIGTLVLMASAVVGTLLLMTLFGLNWLQFRHWAKERGAAEDVWFILALVLVLVLGFVGHIVWAINWNRTLERVEGHAPYAAPSAVVA